MKYEELIKQMRFCAEDHSVVECQDKCPNFGNFRPYEYCFSKLLAEAADAIEELEEKAQALAETLYAYEHPWIPVTERQPEIYEKVLTYGEFGIVVDNYVGDGLFARMTYHVTHYMPLPEPPKEEKDAEQT